MTVGEPSHRVYSQLGYLQATGAYETGIAPMPVGLLLRMAQLSCVLHRNWAALGAQLGTSTYWELSPGLGPRLFTLPHSMQQMGPV